MAKKIDPTNFRSNFHEIEITRTKPSRTSNGWTVRTGSVGGKKTVVTGFRGTTLGEVKGLITDWKKAGIEPNIRTTIIDTTGKNTIVKTGVVKNLNRQLSVKTDVHTKLSSDQTKILNNLDMNSGGGTGIGANDIVGVAGHTGMKTHDARKVLESLERRGLVTKSKINRSLWVLTPSFASTPLAIANEKGRGTGQTAVKAAKPKISKKISGLIDAFMSQFTLPLVNSKCYRTCSFAP